MKTPEGKTLVRKREFDGDGLTESEELFYVDGYTDEMAILVSLKTGLFSRYNPSSLIRYHPKG